MAQESDVFGDDIAACLATPFSLRTPMMATMHEDDSADLVEVSRVLKENLQMPEVSVNARKVVVRVCDIVTRRAARLAAAGIVGMLKKIRRDGSGGIGTVPTKGKLQRTVVAIEGGMYTNYSFFREYLNEAVVEILGDEVSKMVILKVYEDGSGIGTALLAASHSHSSDR